MFTVYYAGNRTTKCHRAAAVGIFSAIIRQEQDRRIHRKAVAALAGPFIDMAPLENFEFSIGRQSDINAVLGSSSERDQLAAAFEEAILETLRHTTHDEVVVGANNAARDILVEFMSLFGLRKSSPELIPA